MPDTHSTTIRLSWTGAWTCWQAQVARRPCIASADCRNPRTTRSSQRAEHGRRSTRHASVVHPRLAAKLTIAPCVPAGMRGTALKHHAVVLSLSQPHGFDSPHARPRSAKASRGYWDAGVSSYGCGGLGVGWKGGVTPDARQLELKAKLVSRGSLSASEGGAGISGKKGTFPHSNGIGWCADDLVKSRNKKLCFFQPAGHALSPRLVPPQKGERTETRREDPLLLQQQYAMQEQSLRQQQENLRQRMSGMQLQQMHQSAGDEIIDADVSNIGMLHVAKSQVLAAIKLGSLRASSRFRIEVEVCRAQRPSLTLRGSSKKYKEKYLELESAIHEISQEPSILEEGPFLTGAFSAMRFCTVLETKASSNDGKGLDGARLGAFEVILVWENSAGHTERIEIFSKLASGLWPHVQLLVQDLSQMLPALADAASVTKITEQYQNALEQANNASEEKSEVVRVLQTKLLERETALLAKQRQASMSKDQTAEKTGLVDDLNTKMLAAEQEVHALRLGKNALLDELSRERSHVKGLEADVFELRQAVSGLHYPSPDTDAQLANTTAELHSVKRAYERLRTDIAGADEMKLRLKGSELENASYLKELAVRKKELEVLRQESTESTDEAKRLGFDLGVVKRALSTAQERIPLLEAHLRAEQQKNVEQQRREALLVAEQQHREAELVAELNATIESERKVSAQLRTRLASAESKVQLAVGALASAKSKMEEAEVTGTKRQEEISDLSARVLTLQDELRHERARVQQESQASSETEAGVRARIPDLEAQLAQERRALREAHRALKDEEGQLDQANQAAETLCRGIDKLKEELARERERGNEVQATKEVMLSAALRVELEGLREQLEQGRARRVREKDESAEERANVLQAHVQEVSALREQLEQERMRGVRDREDSARERAHTLRAHTQELSALEGRLAERQRTGEVREVVKVVEVVKEVEVIKEVEAPANKALETELLSERARVAAEKGRVQQLEQRLQSVQDEGTGMTRAHQQRVQELEADVRRLRQQLEQQQARQHPHDQMADGRLQVALTEAAALRKSLTQQEQALGALSSTIEGEEKEQFLLQAASELAHAKANVDALSKTKIKLEASNASLQETNARLETELALLKATSDGKFCILRMKAIKVRNQATSLHLTSAPERCGCNNQSCLMPERMCAGKAGIVGVALGCARVKYSDPVDAWSQANREIGGAEDPLYTRLRDYEKRLSKVCPSAWTCMWWAVCASKG
jgi:hypothetical protein